MPGPTLGNEEGCQISVLVTQGYRTGTFCARGWYVGKTKYVKVWLAHGPPERCTYTTLNSKTMGRNEMKLHGPFRRTSSVCPMVLIKKKINLYLPGAGGPAFHTVPHLVRVSDCHARFSSLYLLPSLLRSSSRLLLLCSGSSEYLSFPVVPRSVSRSSSSPVAISFFFLYSSRLGFCIRSSRA